MGRQTYIREKDIEASQKTMQQIINVLKHLGVIGLKAEHLRYEDCYAPIGWRLKVNDMPVCLCEIKCRDNTKERYPTYMLSLSRVEDMLEKSRQQKLPLFLIVHWTNVVGGIELTTVPADIRNGGRYDRGDARDEEEVCHWPHQEFALLET